MLPPHNVIVEDRQTGHESLAMLPGEGLILSLMTLLTILIGVLHTRGQE